jgi:hypothetical protein
MHTFGAVILAIVATVIMQLLFGFVSTFLVTLIYASTGMFIIPMIIVLAILGCGYFGGTYFALTLVPGANKTITMLVMMAFIVAGTAWNVAKLGRNDSATLLVLMVLSGIAALLGVFFAKHSYEAEQHR